MSGGEIRRASEDMLPSPQLHGFWHFCWMFWMQPIFLHQLLNASGIEEPGAPAWRLWRINDSYRSARRRYVLRCITMLSGGTAIGNLVAAFVLTAFGMSASLENLALAASYGVAFGVVASIVLGVGFGTAFGAVFGITVGIVHAAEWLNPHENYACICGCVLGAGIAIALNVTLAIANGFVGVGRSLRILASDGPLGVARIFAIAATIVVVVWIITSLTFFTIVMQDAMPAFTRAILVELIQQKTQEFKDAGQDVKEMEVRKLYAQLGNEIDEESGEVRPVSNRVTQERDVLGLSAATRSQFLFGVAFGVAFLLAWLRVPIFLIEIIASLSSHISASFFGVCPLCWSPIFWHDLSYFPLPGLRQRILDEAPHHPALVRRALEACQRSPGQQKIREVALSILKARELKQFMQSRNFTNTSELRGNWLGGDQETDPRLQSLAEASRYLRAASMAIVARHRQQQVTRAQETLHMLRNRLLTDHSKDGSDFQATLDAAEFVASEMYAEARTLAEGQLPNPFIAGDALTPESSQETFRGREDLVRQIELLLNDEKQAAAVSVIAPRRCGKSSLLRMLPVKLPDALCVFFDLQDNPIGAPLDLFPALERRLREQNRPQQRESLPRLRDSSLEAARDWLEALEQRPGRDRILFCLDEFERLEEVVGEKPETKQQLVQLMGLLRATIQHRRRVRILVSGNSTFEELGPLWNDSFISARELRLGPLERDVAIDLIRQPIPVSEGFPEDAVPQAVAEAIVDRTGGQPYLTQLYGFWLVEELNKTKRRQAELQDVETVDQIVFEQAAPFFRDSLNPRGATFAAKPVIEQIVAGQKPELTGNQTRFLMRRGLINADGTLAFPIMARWLNEYAE